MGCGRLGQPVAHHVTDDQGDPTAGRGMMLYQSPLMSMPWPADSERWCTRQFGRLLGSRLRWSSWGTGVLGVVEPGPFQGLCDEGADRGQQRALLVAETAGPV